MTMKDALRMLMKELEKFFYMATENHKLVPTAKVKFLIWSLPAILTCPYATAHCIAECYAVKSEHQYPDCLPSRMRNWDFSKTDLFVPLVSAYIRKKATYRTWKDCKVIVRIHESGDFYSQEYFDKWLAIAANCSDLINVVFMAYTKSLPYVHDVPSNMVVRSSIWDDTTAEMIQLTKELGLTIYTACTAGLWNALPKRNQCDCKSCATCCKCWNEKFEELYCEIH